jgi:hypothetical protein
MRTNTRPPCFLKLAFIAQTSDEYTHSLPPTKYRIQVGGILLYLSIMASVERHFEQVLSHFSKRLTNQELADFKFTSLNDVLVAIESIQTEQGRRKDMMNLTRVRRFLEAMDQYGSVIEVFLNTSSFLCFVWGPMKFCLQVRNYEKISLIFGWTSLTFSKGRE